MCRCDLFTDLPEKVILFGSCARGDAGELRAFNPIHG
jgi:predicted nucleotidyltransferase